MPQSVEARKVLRALNAEQRTARERSGLDIVWTSAEETIIAQICTVLDRKAELVELYDKARSVASKVRLSAEIRLLEQAAARLVRLVNPDVPERESPRARRAAHARWDRDGAG